MADDDGLDTALDHAIDGAVEWLAAHGVPARAGWRGVDPDDLRRLHRSERGAVATAVPTRQHEFASGRALLRELLGADVAIPVGPSRAPVLPAGVHASLSHDGTQVVAVVSTAGRLGALGIDLATLVDLDVAARDVVLRSDESGWPVMLAFSLKEAAYKVWANLGGGMLDHHDIRLTATHDREFVAEIVDRGCSLPGSWSAWDGRVLAVSAAVTPSTAGRTGDR